MTSKKSEKKEQNRSPNSPKSPYANRYTSAQKAEAIKLVLESGYSCRNAAKSIGCSPFTLQRWIDSYDEQEQEKHSGKPQLSWREKLRRRKEKEISNLCRGMRKKSVREKYAFIAANRGKYSSLKLCDLLGVSRSGFYQAHDARPSRCVKQREELRKQITAIYQKSEQAISHQKMWEALRKKGYDCKLWVVRTLCRELGIYGKGHGPWTGRFGKDLRG